MSTSIDLDALVGAMSGRDSLTPLLAALGFEPIAERIPRTAWPHWGVARAAEVDELWRVGRAGSLTALLVEVEGDPEPDVVTRLARGVQNRNPARLYVFLVAGPGYGQVALGLFGLDGTFHHLMLEPDRLLASDREALEDMVPTDGETGLALLVRQAAALDRSRITGRFFRDFRARRAAIAAGWTGLPESAARERAQLALLLLSRLTFLYFLQRRGALAGDDAYLARLMGGWRETGHTSFYRARLMPLFFGVLNRPPEQRTESARRLGPIPYLNGGLFERHALEQRFDELDLPDHEIRACLNELFERYRFTARESGDGAGHGVDPEMLGRVFEGLMAPTDRSRTGSFYTPAPVVDRVVKEAVATYVTDTCSPEQARAVVEGDAGSLPPGTRHRVRAALQRVRVLDPACGSGAFLMGALHRLATALGAVSGEDPGPVRRKLVAGSLHGVDLLDDAALLCALRLWLALAVADPDVRPLPNLDRRIRQGDALLDPLDVGAMDSGPRRWQPLHDPAVRRALWTVEPVARRYVESGPDERADLRGALDRAERRLAASWLRGARTAQEHRRQDLQARAGDRDLFGQIADGARRARAALPRVEERIRELDELDLALTEDGSLPFFSFGVHFADAADGFDLIVSNPPWVRSHRWPERMRRLSRRFEVCRPLPGRTGSLRGPAGAQVDLSLLFLERCIRLLAPGGVLAILLPAKALRALYGATARHMVLRDLDLALIEDHALDPRSVFRADAFAAILIARRRMDGGLTPPQGDGEAVADGNPVRVRLTRRDVEPLEFHTRPARLRLFPADPGSPWVLAPPEVLRVIRAMQAQGPPVGEGGLQVRRGVMTGANDVLLFRDTQPKLGGLAVVEAEGYRGARRKGRAPDANRYRAVVEQAGLRPLVRGADIDAFAYRASGYTVWCHDEAGGTAAAPDRLQRYLEGHRDRLQSRSGWRPGLPLGCLFRIGPHTLRPKVAWHDLSDTVRAVALPARIRREGVDRELIPLNTVYFIPTADLDEARLLAGILNSLPMTVMARAIAERAKDARFRFFAWTIASLPLPPEWRSHPVATEIRRISDGAHSAGGIDPVSQRALDRAVARLFGLSDPDMDALSRFDRWLRGTPRPNASPGPRNADASP